MFLGSFNWDPRSACINTELGVIIESPVIDSTIADRIDEKLTATTYQVIVKDVIRKNEIVPSFNSG